MTNELQNAAANGEGTTLPPAATTESASAAKPDKPPDVPVPTEVVRNCTGDHVVVRAGKRCFRLSPLGQTDVNEETITTFALRDLSDQHVTRLATPVARTGSIESGLIFGIGFWLVIVYFVVLGKINTQPRKLIFEVGAPCAAIIIGLIVVAVLKNRVGDVTFGLSLVMVFILGAGVPVAVVFRFGNLTDLTGDPSSAELFGRLTQTLLISLAALLPTVLYFIFDRQRALTIRHTFQQHILRLDPNVKTLYDIDAKYGDFLIEAIGQDVVGRTKTSRANPYPIFFAAILIVLGWLLVFPVLDDGAGPASAATIASYLTPRRATYVFGFLGAYFFSLNLIARRYVRGDLRPKAYGSITVRVLTVLVLSWVIDVAFAPADWVYVAAFLIGIVPETFFTLIAEGRRALLGKLSAAMREPHPLTSLEGIDLYDRSRLQDEGVNNVEALAHHDLIELMLATRIPVPRLVDWVDQAILYLHVVDEEGNQFVRTYLRSCGIRTASDLMAAHDDLDRWEQLITGDKSNAPQRRLDLIHAAAADDEWIANVQAWRAAPAPGVRSFNVADGNAIRHDPGQRTDASTDS